MRDVVFLAAVVAFFVVAVAYVAACGAIVGRADDHETLDDVTP